MNSADPQIGTLPLPKGGRLGLAAMPGRDGYLAGDLERLIAWKPDIVLSLATMDEMQKAGADRLPALLSRRSIGWMHFPIADFSIPQADQSVEWSTLAAALAARLGAGGSVLLHCQAGLGRSGMVALRLMQLMGEDGQTALARLRSVRPGAIETDAQMQWALAPQSPVRAARGT